MQVPALRSQTQDHFACIDKMLFGLPMLQVSPYYSMGRGVMYIEKMKVVFQALIGSANPDMFYSAAYMNGSTVVETSTRNVPLSSFASSADVVTAVAGDILSYASGQGYTISASDILWVGAAGAPSARTFSSPSLAVNTARQASATQDAFVSAAVDITATLSLTSGQTGKVTLQYADDSAFTTNVVTVNPAVNGNTGTLTIGLGLAQVGTATVCGIIPAAKYYRLLTTNVTGSPSYGTPSIQEVLL